jgi:hypothetical protein
VRTGDLRIWMECNEATFTFRADRKPSRQMLRNIALCPASGSPAVHGVSLLIVRIRSLRRGGRGFEPRRLRHSRKSGGRLIKSGDSAVSRLHLRRLENPRIAAFEIDPSALVHTSWDLGSPRHTVVWYWQLVGREVRMIDVDMGREETITQRVARMFQKPYTYGKHFLPHDALQTERTGNTLRDELSRRG